MRYLTLLVAGGVVGVIILWSDPAQAARRRDNMEDFCRGASDLCVFVCDGRGFDCPTLSDGFICESRHGSLAVEENGETAYYEADYSLCWHRSRSDDDPLPDPEQEPVPRWPGDGETVMCRACDRGMQWCRNGAEVHIDVCLEEHQKIYTRICKYSQKKYGIPRGRNSKEVDTSFTCGVLLEKRDGEASRGDNRGRERERSQRYQECLREALDACLADYRDDHPDDSSEDRWVIGLDKIVKTEYTSGKVLRWGGKVGYESACNQSGVMILDSCVGTRAECARKADPEFSCPREDRGR